MTQKPRNGKCANCGSPLDRFLLCDVCDGVDDEVTKSVLPNDPRQSHTVDKRNTKTVDDRLTKPL